MWSARFLTPARKNVFKEMEKGDLGITWGLEVLRKHEKQQFSRSPSREENITGHWAVTYLTRGL